MDNKQSVREVSITQRLTDPKLVLASSVSHSSRILFVDSTCSIRLHRHRGVIVMNEILLAGRFCAIVFEQNAVIGINKCD